MNLTYKEWIKTLLRLEDRFNKAKSTSDQLAILSVIHGLFEVECEELKRLVKHYSCRLTQELAEK